MSRRQTAIGLFCVLVIAGLTLLMTSVVVSGQGQQFQFVVSAADASGTPVTDLKPEEVLMSENGAPGKVLKVEPYRVPVRLTIAVDNGPDSREALAHYRSGLTRLIEGLPADIEVTLISTAPQPRTVVRPTTDREEILEGINRFAPQDESPRFTDALVEFSKRLQEDLEDRKVADFLPVILMISTTANEVTSYEVPAIEQALGFLARRRARVYVTITNARTGDVASVADINTNRQALIAIPAVKATNGRYETLAISNRLVTLLPEMGAEIAALHEKHVNQVRVTVERPNGATGPLQNPRVELARPGLTGAVSIDGFLP